MGDDSQRMTDRWRNQTEKQKYVFGSEWVGENAKSKREKERHDILTKYDHGNSEQLLTTK